MPFIKESGSFRDPSGGLFYSEGQIFRQINQVYRDDYDCLIQSGLYNDLTEAGRLIIHAEVKDLKGIDGSKAYKIIRPEMVPFISYPYEWSFSQLKQAALATLQIQKIALEHQMILKDASAYNIQFLRGQAVLIDTLSFARYEPGQPWVAYKQFCQHFLAPLALMSYTDIRLNQLLRIYIDGIPLDLASRLLPYKTHFKFALLTHVHLHAQSQRHYSRKSVSGSRLQVTREQLAGLIDHLQSTIKRLQWQPQGTEWADYYSDTNYTEPTLETKKQILSQFITEVKPKNLWDLGANTGVFSRIASEQGIFTVAFDIDPAAVEKNYLQTQKQHDANLLPLLMDLTNPSPALGWDSQERAAFTARGPAEMVLALALIHHLGISNNVPLTELAHFLSKLGRWLVIEFVPKEDSQVQRLLASREDIFDEYNEDCFKERFTRFFEIKAAVPIPDTKRTMYLMQSR